MFVDTMTNKAYLEIANAPMMWAMVIPVVLAMCVQAYIFIKDAMNAGPLVGLTKDDTKKAMRAGILCSIGPGISMFTVMVAFMAIMGGPFAWLRLSIIGTIVTETLGATAGATALGMSLGGPEYGIIGFANSVWVITLNTWGFFIVNLLFAHKIEDLKVVVDRYVDLTTSTPTYYYYQRDHQGNNRAVLSATGTVKETNDYYPFGGLFATNGSVQPYKYNGKELDTKKGLNLYDYGARHYDAALGRFTTVDPSSESYLSLGSYVYCANNPILYIDPTGMDYWSTSDRAEIERFFAAYGQSGGSYSFPSDSWYHMNDEEFQTAYDKYGAQALTYNDQTYMAYTSYGTVENGEVVIHGVSTYMGDSDWAGFNASQSLLLWGMDVGADKLRNSAATFRFLNSKGGWNLKLYKNGWRGNQYVNTSRLSYVGNLFKTMSVLGTVVGGYPSINGLITANTRDKRLEHGLDAFMYSMGFMPYAGPVISLYWSLGGKQLHKSYVEKVIYKQMEMGMNPGLPALQPFK